MSTYWVNYDLKEAGQDYSGLIKYLKSHERWAKPLASSFLVVTNLSASALMNGIKEVVDRNDGVVVIDVSGQSWSTFGASKTINDWLHANV